MSKDLSNKAAHSALWSGINTFSTNFLKFFTTAILARFLTPEEFGVVGLASIFVGLVAVFAQTGLSSALIQRKEVVEDDLRTCFTLTFFLSSLLCVLTILFSGFAADFFRNDLVKPVAILMSFTFVLNGVSNVNSTLLSKNLRFDLLAVINFVAILAQSSTSLILVCIFDMGLWGIVIASILADVTAMCLRFYFQKWFPKFGFSKERFREIFRFSRNVYGSSFVSYFNSNVDYFVVGRILDAATLGYYQFAYSLPAMAQTRFSLIVVRVLFPIFSQVQDDLERFRRGYQKTLRWISLVSFPALFGLALVAHDFVYVVYGERWMPVVEPLRILCFSGMIRSIFYTNGSVLNARGLPHIVFQWGLLMLPVTFLAVYIGAQHGMHGVAWAMTLVLIPTIIPLRYVIGCIEMSWGMYFVSFRPAVVGTAIMGVVVYLIKAYFVTLGLPEIVRLFTLVGIGVCVYLLVILLLFRTECQEFIAFIMKGFKKQKVLK